MLDNEIAVHAAAKLASPKHLLTKQMHLCNNKIIMTNDSEDNPEMTKKALCIEKQRAIRIRVIKVNEKDHWQIWLGRDVVVIIWAIPNNVATLLSRIAYYDNWRRNVLYF